MADCLYSHKHFARLQNSCRKGYVCSFISLLPTWSPRPSCKTRICSQILCCLFRCGLAWKRSMAVSTTTIWTLCPVSCHLCWNVCRTCLTLQQKSHALICPSLMLQLHSFWKNRCWAAFVVVASVQTPCSGIAIPTTSAVNHCKHRWPSMFANNEASDAVALAVNTESSLGAHLVQIPLMTHNLVSLMSMPRFWPIQKGDQSLTTTSPHEVCSCQGC